MTKIEHATKNEIGTLSGGLLGDQNSKEVMVEDFFEYDWTRVFRPKDPALADRLASKAEIIAKNDNVGYGQGSDRYTMYLAAKKLDWDFAAISEPCATDCSQMIATLCISEGLKVSPYMYTGNEEGVLDTTDAFVNLTYAEGMELKRGDILLSQKRGHTAIVVEGAFPSYAPKWVGEAYGLPFIPVYQDYTELSPRCGWPTLAAGNLFDVCDETTGWFFARIAGEYYGWVRREYVLRKTPYAKGKVASDVYVRTNPGAQYKKIGVLKSGTVVEICDEKLASNGAAWYYIKSVDGFGFSSAKYIRKQA